MRDTPASTPIADQFREPLQVLAELAWNEAPSRCDPDHGCLDYHRVWSLIRLLELDGALPAGREFFLSTIKAQATSAPLRILISGGADTGVTAMILSCCAQAGVTPELIFVDRCQTSVAQNQKFAALAGAKIDIHCDDATTLAIAPVDLIVAHSFIGYFNFESAVKLAQNWALNLRSGGVVAIMQNTFRQRGFSHAPQKRADFESRALALQVAAKKRGLPDEICVDIHGAALRLWLMKKDRFFVTDDELRDIFIAADLQIEHQKIVPVTARTGPVTGTIDPNLWRRNEMTARKPTTLKQN